MNKITKYKQFLSKLNEGEFTRVKSELLPEFVQSATLFATQVKEQEKLIKQLGKLEKKINRGAKTPKEEEEVLLAQEMFEQAKEAELNIKRKREVIKALRSQLVGLTKALKK